MSILPKAYEPSEHEHDIAVAERDSGLYNPDNLPGDRPQTFTMILPPPNATGILHMGHAVMLAVQDTMARFERMRGRRVLWLPGTDHAAIATHAKVERLLKEETGHTRHDIGREAFVRRIDAFVEQSRDTIRRQMRAMGASLDWSREAFTLDVARHRAVRTAFKRFYDDGLIYRGARVINWDPQGQTVISDDELVYEERPATLYTFRYGADIPIPIATTRPETKVGDTAIAVHPEGRWRTYIGREFDTTFAGAALHLRVVGDAEVDDAFGTGALGVTPAHSMADFEMAQRHALPLVQVIGEDARMMEQAGTLVAGMPVREARAAIVDWLREQNLLECEEDIVQNVSTAERTGAVIEPLPKRQWFINVNKSFAYRASPRAPLSGLRDGDEVTLKSLMQLAVRSGQVRMIPERFSDVYFAWVDHLRDWCISRQIWYGHRIPVWYCVACGQQGTPESMRLCSEPIVSLDDLVSCPHCGGVVQQDPDTLDTWFSSGLWSFSTLGWPDESSPDLVRYHPTDLLETGRDIIFFWVARMILMSTYLLGEVPFRYAYLHGLVRDGQGRKMSKSLDNIIDPLDMIAAYGTDATRLSLLIGQTPGNDVNLSQEKVAGFRNFANKLWNIARFVLMTVERAELVEEAPEPRTEADRWVLWRLSAAVREATEHIALPNMRLSQAGEVLRDMTWGDVADWYVEAAKIQRQDDALREHTDRMLLYILQVLLRVWHPFMPFVTTRLYRELAPERSLMVEAWPELALAPRSERFELAKAMVTAIRGVRAAYRIAPTVSLEVVVTGDGVGALDDISAVVRGLARVSTLRAGTPPPQSVAVTLSDMTMHIPLGDVLDVSAERERMVREAQALDDYIARTQTKLSNKAFIANAPEEVVANQRVALDDARTRREMLKSLMDGLK